MGKISLLFSSKLPLEKDLLKLIGNFFESSYELRDSGPPLLESYIRHLGGAFFNCGLTILSTKTVPTATDASCCERVPRSTRSY